MRLSRGSWRNIVVLVAAVASMALTARLGVWQLSRAAQKQSMQRALDQQRTLPELTLTELPRTAADAVSQHYRSVRLRGTWVASGIVYLDNRQMEGRPGFFVMVPLRLEDGRAVVVQRGWFPRAFDDRTRLQAVRMPRGDVTVAGRIAPPPGRLYDFEMAASGAIRQNLDLSRFGAEIGLNLLPWSLVEDEASPAAAGDGLARRWPAPALGIDTHYGYAFQWFGLSALIAILYVWFRILRPRFRRDT